MKLPARCKNYPDVLKNFLVNIYFPFNKLNYYINNNLYDNLWEDFKYDDNLLDALVMLKKMIQKEYIEIPERFDLSENWVQKKSYIQVRKINDRATYLAARCLYLKDMPE